MKKSTDLREHEEWKIEVLADGTTECCEYYKSLVEAKQDFDRWKTDKRYDSCTILLYHCIPIEIYENDQ